MEAPEEEKSGQKALRMRKEWAEVPKEEKKSGQKPPRKRKKWMEAPEDEKRVA